MFHSISTPELWNKSSFPYLWSYSDSSPMSSCILVCELRFRCEELWFLGDPCKWGKEVVMGRLCLLFIPSLCGDFTECLIISLQWLYTAGTLNCLLYTFFTPHHYLCFCLIQDKRHYYSVGIWEVGILSSMGAQLSIYHELQRPQCRNYCICLACRVTGHNR